MGEILSGRFRSGPEFSENLIIFHGLSSNELNDSVDRLRDSGVAALKAVTTPTNLGWTVEALYRELCRERKKLSKR